MARLVDLVGGSGEIEGWKDRGEEGCIAIYVRFDFVHFFRRCDGGVSVNSEERWRLARRKKW